jgi:pleckstrin homology domain containing family A member 8
MYSFLQAIIQHEIDEKLTTVRNSATDALLWLKRAIWFLREFFHELIYAKNGEINACIAKSYELTLKQYHNWIVKGIFSIALKAVPTRENFFRGLSLKETNTDENCPSFQQKV